MQRLIILITILVGTHFVSNAQESKESGIYFGAIVGTKYNDFNNHFVADIEPKLYSFSIGAGSAWTKNNFLVGLEFLYAGANKDNATADIQYIGFSNTLFFGYNFSKSKTWKLEPYLGLVFDGNQLIVENKSTGDFQNLINNQLAANIGLNLKIIDAKGLFTGLKIGYMLPFAGDTSWEQKVSGNNAGLKDNMGSFYLQLNLGGFLNFTKNQ